VNSSELIFSIIIPTRNRARLLERCIASILIQSFEDWELIIVDDGSEDNTISIVSNFNDSRITYYFQNHQERSAARNHGIDQAKGRYVCFVDDDDTLKPDYLNDFYTYYEKNGFPNEILRTGFVRIEDNVEQKSALYDVEKHSNPIEFALFNMCGVVTLSIPREFLKKERFPIEFPHWQDTHLIIRLLLKYNFIQLNSFNYNYIQHDAMGSRLATRAYDPIERAELNVSAMDDLFRQYGRRIGQFVPKKTLRFLKAEKYIEYANAVKKNEIMSGRKLLRRSIKEGFFFRLWKHYLIWLIR
jgi:glycosyltransferase involved in cell wall biosynthesis